MSLILEALRKSEEEHQAPKTHVLVPAFSKRAAPETRPFIGQRYAIGIFLVLSGLLVIGILYRSSFLSSEYSQPKPDDKSWSKQDHLKESNANHAVSTSYGETIEPDLIDLKPLKIEQTTSSPEISNTTLSPQQASPHTANEINQSGLPPHTKTFAHAQRVDAQQTRNPTDQVTPVGSQLHLLDTPHINEISPQIEKQLPTLRYESHWYDKQPDKRTVIINSQNLKEGARLSAHLRVHSITKDGCILDYKGQLFHILMLQSWPETD